MFGWHLEHPKVDVYFGSGIYGKELIFNSMNFWPFHAESIRGEPAVMQTNTFRANQIPIIKLGDRTAWFHIEFPSNNVQDA